MWGGKTRINTSGQPSNQKPRVEQVTNAFAPRLETRISTADACVCGGLGGLFPRVRHETESGVPGIRPGWELNAVAEPRARRGSDRVVVKEVERI